MISIVSFEPGREAFARLQENVLMNGLHQVELHCVAVSDARGMVHLHQNQDLINRIALADEVESGSEAIGSVPCVTLDEELHAERYDLGKIDVEGAELMAFRGAARLLKQANPPVWLVELKDRLLRRYGGSSQELVDVLQAHGFALGTYNADHGELSFPPGPWQDRENVLAIHGTALDRVRSRLAAGFGLA